MLTRPEEFPGEHPAIHPLAGAKRLVVLRNPASRHAGIVSKKLRELQHDSAELEHLGIGSMLIDDTSPDHADNVARLHSLGPRDAVAVAGGDGSVSDIYAASLEVPLQWPISAFAGGNANDLAHMQYGRRRVNSPEKIIRDAKIATIRPLRVVLQPYGEEPTTHFAFGYFGMGFTARLAQSFNSHDFRDRVEHKPDMLRAGYDAAEIFKHFRSLKTFGISEPSSGRSSEILFMNGRRMAKIIYCHDNELTGDGARYEQTANGRRTSLLAGIRRLAVGASATLVCGESHRYTIDQPEGVMGQIDGESFHIKDKNTVLVSLADKVTNVTTTR